MSLLEESCPLDVAWGSLAQRACNYRALANLTTRKSLEMRQQIMFSAWLASRRFLLKEVWEKVLLAVVLYP